MRKLLNLFKHNTLFGIIIGIVICSITIVIAETINSDEVLYDNSNSSSNKENVQDALDDIYNIIDHNSVGFSLLTNTPTGLSSELVGGLYRYQGVQDVNNTVDNYICFGTTNKSDCVSDTDKYMYRIIGINTSGQMKLIKKEALNTAYAWNSTSGANWPQSDLYAGLNGSYFLTNTTYISDSTWSNRIAMVNWLYGRVNNGNVLASEVYNIESNLSDSVNAKIGLMYLHDYYYGLPGGNNCNSSASTCRKSWIYISNNDNNPPYNQEWFCVNNWRIFNDGQARDSTSNSAELMVRPVFFLRASERIASGSGTITDPYILE